MSESTLLEYASTFSEAVCGNFRDMVGAEYAQIPSSLEERRFSPAFGMTVMIHFTGAIQGEYAISLSEETACRLIGAWSDGMSDEDLKALRGDYVGFLKEALNTSVGMAIQILESQFESLTFLPPVVVYGELEYPEVPCGSIRIQGDAGEVECGIVINMMGLELGERLHQALRALGESVREAEAAKRSVVSMLEAFPSGLVAVDRVGKVRPGYSQRTASTVGLPESESLSGLDITDLLGFEENAARDMKTWLEVVHARFGTMPFADLAGLCPIEERENARGLLLKLEWVPLNGESGELDGLLLMIEDITEKRRIEREMKKLARLHEENVELLSQIVNLEPDEVSEFVYDTHGLLKEAQRIVQDANRDRRFIETLYRTVHTLKGNSGQYQFRGLQKLAMEVENEIQRLRSVDEWDSTSEGETDEVEKIEKGLEEAEGYIRRLEELQSKLGRRDEQLSEKAGRSVPAVLVPLREIDGLAASVWGLRETAKALGFHRNSLDQLQAATVAASRMREVSIARLGSSLQTVVAKLATRLQKKARFVLAGSATLDVEVIRTIHRCLVHLLNNAMDHGIEMPEVRMKAGKIETGIISMDCERRGNDLVVAFADDGKGIDVERVRRKIVQKGLLNEEGVAKLSEKATLAFLFESGFSTCDNVTETSGRGVGLDVVRDALVALGGRVELENRPGLGARFLLFLPLQVAIPSTRYLATESGA